MLYSFDVPGNTSGSTGWNVAFCIEPLVSTNNGEVYPAPIPISSYSKNTAKMQKELGLIGHYGYCISPTQKNRQFTQMLIWEHRGATLEAIRYKDVDVKSEYNTFKTNVMFHVNSHVIKPSFNNMTYEVNAGETITITDTNGYFKDFSLVDSGGFSLNHNGNSLTITASKTANDNTITFRKLANHNLETALIYSDPTRQDIGILNDIATQDSEHIQVDNNPLQIEVIK